MYHRITRGRADPAKSDELTRLMPDLRVAIQQLPGCQGVQFGFDRATGKSVSVSTFDTLEHAQFTRESLGEPLARVVAVGWQPEAPEIYEGIE